MCVQARHDAEATSWLRDRNSAHRPDPSTKRLRRRAPSERAPPGHCAGSRTPPAASRSRLNPTLQTPRGAQGSPSTSSRFKVQSPCGRSRSALRAGASRAYGAADLLTGWWGSAPVERWASWRTEGASPPQAFESSPCSPSSPASRLRARFIGPRPCAGLAGAARHPQGAGLRSRPRLLRQQPDLWGRARCSVSGAFLEAFGFLGELANEAGTDELRASLAGYPSLPHAKTDRTARWGGAAIFATTSSDWSCCFDSEET